MNYELTLPPNYKKIPLPGLTEWVEALRSKKYQQGFNHLHSGSCYCCLGVLSKLQGRLTQSGTDGVQDDEFGDDINNVETLSEENPLYPIIGDAGNLPVELMVWVNNERKFSLAEVNDAGVDFEGVANILLEIYEHEPNPLEVPTLPVP